MAKGVGKANRTALAGAAALVLVLGAAGSPPVSAQTSGCLPTSDRTIGRHGFPGLGIKKKAPVFTDAAQWASFYKRPSAVGQEAAVLTGEGFRSAIAQLYFGRKRKTKGDQGVSTAEQFQSNEGAQAELNRVLGEVLGEGGWKQFTVSAIPGSRGVRDRFAGGGASNVFFVDGDYFYVVGRYVQHGGTGADAVINGSTRLFGLVYAAAACP